MPVLFPKITTESLFPVAGVRLGITQAGIKKALRDDCLIIVLDEGAEVAGVFTQNKYCAAPVQISQSHLAKTQAQNQTSKQSIRALVINTGCANAGTGAQGLEDARSTCAALAKIIGCQTTQILPFSTGVIMEYLPMDKLLPALPLAYHNFANWLAAAQTIMTTDTLPKASSRQVTIDDQLITITGISKGAGMIAPNMATMLGFVLTDALVPNDILQSWCGEIADASFNAITIDGDTSTNDSFMLIATGKHVLSAQGLETLRATLTEVATELAQLIVRDAEGATKFITLQINGGKTRAECRQIARAIAHSPLVKTAFYANDPNLGRILAAIGYAGVDDLDTNLITLYLNEVLVAQFGGRAASYEESAGKAVMAQAEITVRVLLNRGTETYTLWTSDLSHEYVSINADYRS